jgi:uncharacterized protein
VPTSISESAHPRVQSRSRWSSNAMIQNKPLAPRRLAVFVSICIVISAYGYWWYTDREVTQWLDLSAPGGTLRVLVADTAESRAKGLAGRDVPPADGLLLKWEAPGRHPIWMANMRFALDVVWLTTDGRVAAVLSNVPACSAQPCPLYEPEGTDMSQAVLELPAGQAARLAIVAGAVIRQSRPCQTGQSGS